MVACEGRMLVPALLDLQIYGSGGLLFAEFPTVEALQTLARDNREAGVYSCLVTIPTQSTERILQCLHSLNEYMEQGGDGIMGLHLEGPFINPVKKGAHFEEWIHVPTVEEVDRILEAAKGHLKMVTLAPELCGDEVLNRFIENDVVIAGGHSNANVVEANEFSGRGVKLVTHLYNAMSGLHHRDPGIPAAVFQDGKIYASCIPDGYHVHWEMLKLAKNLMGERLYFITDSVTETRSGAYLHHFDDDRYILPDGTLSGSSLNQLQSVKNGIRFMNLTLEESLRMASLYPARVMGLGEIYGKLKPGYQAKILLMDGDLNIHERIGF